MTHRDESKYLLPNNLFDIVLLIMGIQHEHGKHSGNTESRPSFPCSKQPMRAE